VSINPTRFIPVWMSLAEAEEFRRFLQEEARTTDGEFPEREFGLVESALREERSRSFDEMQLERASEGELVEAVRAYFNAPSSAGVDRILAALPSEL
jgi:hypothetical protein